MQGVAQREVGAGEEGKGGTTPASAAGSKKDTKFLNFKPGTSQKLPLRRPPSTNSVESEEESEESQELRDYRPPSREALEASGATAWLPPPPPQAVAFAKKYGYGLPDKTITRTAPYVEQAAMDHVNRGLSRADKALTPEEFARKYGYDRATGKRWEPIEVAEGGASKKMPLRAPPRTESLESADGPYETLPDQAGGLSRVDMALTPEEFARKYEYHREAGAGERPANAGRKSKSRFVPVELPEGGVSKPISLRRPPSASSLVSSESRSSIESQHSRCGVSEESSAARHVPWRNVHRAAVGTGGSGPLSPGEFAMKYGYVREDGPSGSSDEMFKQISPSNPRRSALKTVLPQS
jgi:hypothetical protein